jgi:hypothetical protein
MAHNRVLKAIMPVGRSAPSSLSLGGAPDAKSMSEALRTELQLTMKHRKKEK